MAAHNRLVVAFDFDGTLATGGRFGSERSPLELRQDVKGLTSFLKSKRVDLVLWTCRSGEHLDEAKEFLQRHGVMGNFVAVNENVPDLGFVPSAKIFAHYYVDDRAFGWRWDKRDRWLPLIMALERDSFFDPHKYLVPGFLVSEYLEYLRVGV